MMLSRLKEKATFRFSRSTDDDLQTLFVDMNTDIQII